MPGPTRRQIERRIDGLASASADADAPTTTVDLTDEVRAAMQDILRYRYDQWNDDDYPEITPERAREALEHMDGDLAAALRSAEMAQVFD